MSRPRRDGIYRECLECKKVIWVFNCYLKVGRGKYCSRACAHKNLTGPIIVKNGTFKGYKSFNGSVSYREMVRLGKGKYKERSRLVVERTLGRKLKRWEVVHHMDCNSLNNQNSNLLVCSPKYHQYLHGEYSRRYGQLKFAGGT